MPINSTQGVASEAQIFLAFHALKVRKRLSPFDDPLKNGTSLPARIPRRSDASRWSGRAAMDQRVSRHLLARDLTREGRTITCLIAAQPVNLSRSEPTGLGLLVIEGVFDLSERT